MIAIIGAGAAGLTAGRILQAAGKHVEIFEAQPRVGGRVGSRTITPDASDIVGAGWTLDLGFQVLLSAYPAVQRQLDLTALDFQPLSAGALLCRGDQRYPVSDPFRQPQELWSTATNPQLSILDKLKILELRQWLNSQPAWQWLKGPDISTLAFLQQFGFSNQAINHFFVPFFGGIFLDTQLNTSALLFKYYFALLSQGDIGVPKGGMQRIPEQLAQGLTVHLSSPVLKLSPNTTSNGYQLLTPQGAVSAEQVIIATDPFNAQRLCGNNVPKSVRQAYYFYFVAPSPAPDPVGRVLLNNNSGVICNAMWYDHSLGYNYTHTESLLLVTVLPKHPPQDMASLHAQVRQELQLWYGNASQEWICIWEYHIPYVGFDQQAGFSQHLSPWCSPLPQVYYASEANSYGGLGGAIESGEKIAALLLHDVHSLSRPRGA